MSIKGTSAAFALAGALLAASAPAVLAAPAAVNRNAAKVADAGQAHATPVSDSDDDASSANCSKSRRRLWIEGEGWIVRKVTTCH